MAAHPKKRKTNDVLCIKMFGSFSISQIPAKAMRDITTTSGNAPTAEIALARIDTFTSVEPVAEITASLSGRAHRLWLLVAYLIVNRDHGVSPQELIDLLWPEVTSNNPASTLQNNVSRARALFSEANFDDARDLIKHTDGLYYWAPERSTLLDTEIFEANVRRIGDFLSAEDTEGIDLALETCKLYTGDFLDDATDITWCANLAVYYRTLYKRLCKTTIVALIGAGRLKEAQALCLQVCAVDPAAEEFSLLLMQAYLADANPTAALEQYQTIANYLSQTYDIQPSAELETQREIALQELYGQSMDEQGIRTFLFESNDDEGAFACSNAVFREIALYDCVRWSAVGKIRTSSRSRSAILRPKQHAASSTPNGSRKCFPRRFARAIRLPKWDRISSWCCCPGRAPKTHAWFMNASLPILRTTFLEQNLRSVSL